MYFTKTRKFILAVLVAVVAFTFVGLFYQEKVYAISASDTVAYPFATEDYALANAPTFTGVASQQDGDTWHWAEQIFDNPVDQSNAYIKAILKKYEGKITNQTCQMAIRGYIQERYPDFKHIEDFMEYLNTVIFN